MRVYRIDAYKFAVRRDGIVRNMTPKGRLLRDSGRAFSVGQAIHYKSYRIVVQSQPRVEYGAVDGRAIDSPRYPRERCSCPNFKLIGPRTRVSAGIWRSYSISSRTSYIVISPVTRVPLLR